jgi:hypothetical protein
MKELNKYRVRLINQFVASAVAFREACLAVKDPFAPVEAEGWNVHQLATHTRDVDRLVYGPRARRTAQEDNPEFANFDGDAHVQKYYSADEPLPELLDDFVASVKSLADMLRSLAPEAWSRVSRHEKLGGGLTLQLWVERGLAHIEEHLATVRKLSQ